MQSDLALTGQVPGIVLVEREARRVVLLELTWPFDTEKGMKDAMERKQERYFRLSEDIHMKGYTVLNLPLEVTDIQIYRYITIEDKVKLNLEIGL